MRNSCTIHLSPCCHCKLCLCSSAARKVVVTTVCNLSPSSQHVVFRWIRAMQTAEGVQPVVIELLLPQAENSKASEGNADSKAQQSTAQNGAADGHVGDWQSAGSHHKVQVQSPYDPASIWSLVINAHIWPHRIIHTGQSNL